MSARRIHVRISPIGEITVEADGFQGKGCEAATQAIEEALGKPATRATASRITGGNPTAIRINNNSEEEKEARNP